ncbi:DUF31 family protein [Mycoplasma sp. CSL10137]|uniref:Ig-specific serine endopeptidase MIP n=1 Tax=Mycoplasma sp. CSL10137 TaxID=2813824 RepID=UPI00197C2125|nr:DUF31 family protein [Mycoplasma sp. CSL10137]MBN4083481.1 DUF31 family protein [Mycoplasma sp. CSL10137]
MKKNKWTKLLSLTFGMTSIVTAISCGANNKQSSEKANSNSTNSSENEDQPTSAIDIKKNKVTDLINFLPNDVNKDEFINKIREASDDKALDAINNEIKKSILENGNSEQLVKTTKEISRRIVDQSKRSEINSKIDDANNETNVSNKNKQLLNLFLSATQEAEKPATEEQKKLSKQKFTEVVTDPAEGTHFNFAFESIRNQSKSEVLPSQVIRNMLLDKFVPTDEYAWFLDIEVNNAKGVEGEKNPNKTGNVVFYVTFKNRLTRETSEVKQIQISGFKSNQQGTDENGEQYGGTELGGLQKPTSNNEITEYVKKTPIEKFKYDDNIYLTALKNYIKSAGDLQAIRPELTSNTDENIKFFNKKAEEVGFSPYESAVYKGFTLPKYGSNNSVEGLALNDVMEIGKKDSWVDSLGKKPGNDQGLARTITNKNYLDASYITYHVEINNYLASEDENQRNLLRKHVKNPEKLKEFAEKINDKNAKDEFIRRINEAHGDTMENPLQDYLEQITIDIFRALVQQMNGDENGAARIYTDYLNKYKDVVLNKIKSDNEINEQTKQNAENFIRKAQSMWDIQNKFIDSQDVIAGTIWIMDYELPESGHYPTKFYFGTNLHVADAINPSRFAGMSITNVNKESVRGDYSKLKVIPLDSDKYNTGVIQKESLKRIFDAKDYLKTNPSQYLINKQQEKYKDVQEFLDFSIFEIDFEKISTNELKGKSPQEFAKWITNDYANWKDEDKVKFKSESYLKNYEKINNPILSRNVDLNKLDQLIILGYPKSKSNNWFDWFIKQYVEEDQMKVREHGYSLWTNADGDYYNKTVTEDEFDKRTKEKLDRGNFLSYNVAWRGFIDKPGVVDAFISSPTVGAKQKPFDNLYVSDDNKKYILYGLEYLPRNYVPGGGASGSGVRTKNNEMVSVYHASFQGAKTGLSSAFRSEGYNYKGLFGDYNLPQYDLIYGGGKDQQNSYRESMEKLFKENKVKNTWLFPNGFEKTNIPTEFQFDNNKLIEYTPTKNTSDI